MSDPCDYIRNTYDVPAVIGGRVRINFLLPRGCSQTGTIKGADSHLYVLLDGEKEPRRFHPAWLITYYNQDGTIAKRCGDD